MQKYAKIKINRRKRLVKKKESRDMTSRFVIDEMTDQYIDVVESALLKGKRVDMILTAEMVRPILMAVVKLRNDNIKLCTVGLELAKLLANLEDEKRKNDLTSMSFV
mgnify:CR=1 FL=1